eukprot:1234402-Amphidinium_carterae.3
MKRSRIEGQGVKRASTQSDEELQDAQRIDVGQSSTHGSSPSDVISHLDMISNVMQDLEESHIITAHSLTVNEEKTEKAIQMSTSDVILQDWHPNATLSLRSIQRS